MIDLSDFITSGIHRIEFGVDSTRCRALLDKVLGDRDFGPDLFLPEAVFRADPKFKGVNPEPGRNLAETLEKDTRFIDQDENIVEHLSAVLGKGYRIMDKKFVCGVPQDWIPKWVVQFVKDSGVKNLGGFVKPQYRDITYFSGIDFHQDIIDWPEMGPTFATLYIYLDEVGIHDAPLHVIEGTHLFGATRFPHRLEMIDSDTWQYGDDEGNKKIVRQTLLTGNAGDANLWHPFTLHGTQPDKSSNPRISLRYLIQVGDPSGNCGLARVNKTISGRHSLKETRKDLDEQGKAVLKGNYVNKIKY